MKEFNEVNKKDLQREDYCLVQCNMWSPSGYDIAQWDGKEFISETNQGIMTKFVEGFMRLDDLPIV